ncbi:hypothetical protein MTO96_035914 [Rhipicephalus appendiculatus]
MAARSEGPASHSSDPDVAHGAEVFRPPPGAAKSSSQLEARGKSALRDAPHQAKNQGSDDGAPPKEQEKRVSSEERQLCSSPVVREYDAAMTPFQRKVVNVTFCFSVTVIGVAVLVLMVVALSHHVKRLSDASQACRFPL